ncbi:MAG: uroporphyrinogen-III synthase, partial [Nitrospinota bacterium]
VPGHRVLLPRARDAREALPEAIRTLGGTIDVVEAYRTEAPQGPATATLARRLKAGEIDSVTFTSSSTVTNFLALVANHGGAALLDGVAVACIGPITAETARAVGLAPAVIAKTYTIEGLVDALIEHFAPPEGSR